MADDDFLLSDWLSADPASTSAPPPAAIRDPEFLERARAWGADRPLFPAAGFSPSTVEDINRSVPSGLIKGFVGLPGLPGTLAEAGNQGIDFAVRKFKSMSPEERVAYDDWARRRQDQYAFPTSQQVIDSFERNVSGPLYEPRTAPGRYAQTTAEFVPGLIGGPETLGAKLVPRVIGPAIGSQAAADAAEGTGYEGLASLAGAIAGHGVARAPAAAGRIGVPAETAPRSTPTSRVLDRVTAEQASPRPAPVGRGPLITETEIQDAEQQFIDEGKAISGDRIYVANRHGGIDVHDLSGRAIGETHSITSDLERINRRRGGFDAAYGPMFSAADILGANRQFINNGRALVGDRVYIANRHGGVDVFDLDGRQINQTHSITDDLERLNAAAARGVPRRAGGGRVDAVRDQERLRLAARRVRDEIRAAIREHHGAV